MSYPDGFALFISSWIRASTVPCVYSVLWYVNHSSFMFKICHCAVIPCLACRIISDPNSFYFASIWLKNLPPTLISFLAVFLFNLTVFVQLCEKWFWSWLPSKKLISHYHLSFPLSYQSLLVPSQQHFSIHLAAQGSLNCEACTVSVQQPTL